MKKRKRYFFVFFLLIIENAQAKLLDSITIPEVNIIAIRENYFATQNSNYKIDSFQTHFYGQNSIADVLQYFTPIQINTNGLGGISTLSVRGTGDDQTSVFWNGIKINSVTLGSIDVSLIPTAAANKISVITNASGTTLGSGTFGGAILLNNEPDFRKKTEVGIRQDFSSFKNFKSSITIATGNNKIQFSSASFYQTMKNNFPFYDYYKIDTPLVNTLHNATKQWATVNTFHIKLKKQQQINFGNFTLKKQHEIPAIMGSYQQVRAYQNDFSTKTFFQYQKIFSNAQLYVRSGYVYDFMFYNDSLSNIKTAYYTHQLQNSINYRHYFKHSITLDGGLDYTMEYAKTVAYSNKYCRNRGAVFLGAKYSWKNITINATIRQEFLKSKYIRPQFSTMFTYIHKNNYFTTSISYADKFRLPDFNDLYWIPGGNKNLLPENGFTLEYTFNLQPILKTKIYKLNFINTVYYSEIKNNIVWSPILSGLYSPQNLKKTKHYGIESTLRNIFLFNDKTNLQIAVNYNFNRAIIVNDATNTALNGNYIRYKPQHTLKANFIFDATYFNLGANVLYVSKRFSDDENIKVFALKPYVLTDLFIAFKGAYKNVNAEFAFIINNLTNTKYESLRSYAQPLRNYTISILLNYKSTKNEQKQH